MPQLTAAEQTAIAKEVAEILQRRSLVWAISSGGGPQAITISIPPPLKRATEAAERPQSTNPPAAEKVLPQNPSDHAPVSAPNPNAAPAPAWNPNNVQAPGPNPINILAPDPIRLVRNDPEQELIERFNYPGGVAPWSVYGLYAPNVLHVPQHGDDLRYAGRDDPRYPGRDQYHF